MLTINLSPFPKLVTSRLLLRQLTLDDAQDLFELRSDERVMQFIERPRAKTIDDAVALIEKINNMIEANDGINWGISLQNEIRLIGMISFHAIEKEHYRAEIGYLLHPDFQRMGIMNEAMAAVLSHGFEVLKFHSITANVNPENIASCQLLEKNGFIREAYFKENFFWEGKFLDTSIYSILNPNQ